MVQNAVRQTVVITAVTMVMAVDGAVGMTAVTTASIASDHVRCHPLSEMLICSSSPGPSLEPIEPGYGPVGRRDRRWSRGSPPPVPPAGMRPRCSKRTTPAERHTPSTRRSQPVSSGSASAGDPLGHPDPIGRCDHRAIISRHALDPAPTVEHCVGRRFSHPDLVVAGQAVCPMRGPSPISGEFAECKNGCKHGCTCICRTRRPATPGPGLRRTPLRALGAPGRAGWSVRSTTVHDGGGHGPASDERGQL